MPLAYRAIKSIQREARVGTAVNMRYMKPAHGWNPLDKQITGAAAPDLQHLLPGYAGRRANCAFSAKSTRVPEAAGTQDFVGINYYTGDLVSFNLFNPSELFSKRSLPQRRRPERYRISRPLARGAV